MLILVIIAVFAMCLCIFNYWMQKEKYNRLMDEEIKKLSVFNSPSAWLIYAFVFMFSLLGTLTYYIYKLYVMILKS